jgi:hypothetical protein
MITLRLRKRGLQNRKNKTATFARCKIRLRGHRAVWKQASGIHRLEAWNLRNDRPKYGWDLNLYKGGANNPRVNTFKNRMLKGCTLEGGSTWFAALKASDAAGMRISYLHGLDLVKIQLMGWCLSLGWICELYVRLRCFSGFVVWN